MAFWLGFADFWWGFSDKIPSFSIRRYDNPVKTPRKKKHTTVQIEKSRDFRLFRVIQLPLSKDPLPSQPKMPEDILSDLPTNRNGSSKLPVGAGPFRCTFSKATFQSTCLLQTWVADTFVL